MSERKSHKKKAEAQKRLSKCSNLLNNGKLKECGIALTKMAKVRHKNPPLDKKVEFLDGMMASRKSSLRRLESPVMSLGIG